MWARRVEERRKKREKLEGGGSIYTFPVASGDDPKGKLRRATRKVLPRYVLQWIYGKRKEYAIHLENTLETSILNTPNTACKLLCLTRATDAQNRQPIP